MKEIDDNEIRIVGQSTHSTRGRKPWVWLFVVAGVVLMALLLFLLLVRPSGHESAQPTPPTPHEVLPTTATDTLMPQLYVQDTVVNDVPLTLYFPRDATPSLCLGMPDTTRLLLAVMAADIRADNGEIVGDFVLDGHRLARGERKEGFCALLGHRLSIHCGTDADSAARYLHEAMSTGGSFFRQYALVVGAQATPPKPKGKNHRRALCLIAGEVVVVASADRESYADFAMALADLGATDALALVGSESLLIYRPEGGLLHSIGTNINSANANFLVWHR